MILRKNQDLFNLVRSLAGVNQFTSNEVNSLVDFTNRRLTTAYNTSQMWSRYVVSSEPRKIAALRIENSTNSVNGNYFLLGSVTGTGVKSGSSLYYNSSAVDNPASIVGTIIYQNSDASQNWVISTSGIVTKSSDGTFTVTNTGTAQHTEADLSKKDFPYDVEHWNSSGDAGAAPTIFQKQFIPYSETRTVSEDITKTTIGEFIRIHRNKAFLNNSATEYDFFVDEYGANILNSSITDNTAYVTYKKNIVSETTGKVISSLDTDGTSDLKEIPLEFFNYTAHSVFADFLRLDGQTDKAFAEEQKASEFLVEELEKVDIINNRNSLNHKFSTYINTSSR